MKLTNKNDQERFKSLQVYLWPGQAQRQAWMWWDMGNGCSARTQGLTFASCGGAVPRGRLGSGTSGSSAFLSCDLLGSFLPISLVITSQDHTDCAGSFPPSLPDTHEGSPFSCHELANGLERISAAGDVIASQLCPMSHPFLDYLPVPSSVPPSAFT